ncbi:MULTISPECIES: ester cyclase [unclassified Streptomyces]|uniref:ester cyclase n=1 Tax=unclassified Streptomyces TaxID=2593676 RepID=UPI001BE72000|nr:MULTISPECIES: ester cyclase [unclassified Streptomyces]MBT2405531.1 ester cyclase [Streptomyces sp. ISL-21]MBT2454450.1 ester cyclase [Streptomyces sp. ISL-86]MBT2607790.1 ester cyclase [Streptomyces sp. ISL-87]
MSEEGTKLVHTYYEEFLTAPGNLQVADRIMAPDVIFDNPISPNGIHGLPAYKEFALRWYGGFPDRVFTIDDLLEQDDKVAAAFTITGTHQGVFMGAAPTGQHIEVRGMNIFRIEDGLIKEVTAYFDPRQLLAPLGLAG